MCTEDDTISVLESIRSQSRSSAIAERQLIDVTHEARRHGISYPTALSYFVWDGGIRAWQDTPGRIEVDNLARVLTALGEALKDAPRPPHPFVFSAEVTDDRGKLRLSWFTVVCDPDDDGEPCLTVLFGCEC